MAKYKIAWLPGDGVGVDVMEATRVVLDKMKIDAEYPHGDIGWEFWCREGNPLPDRTIKLLKETDCALFGAITSKPKEEAQEELIGDLKGKNLIYSSPIVRLRQEFDLRTNKRPCKAYEGNPLNFKEGIDITVFRENTEDLYVGVEYYPIPKDLSTLMASHNKKMKRFAEMPEGEVAMSCRLISKTASRNIIRDAFEEAKKTGKKAVTIVEKPNVLRETSGVFVREGRKLHKDYPGIELWETNIDAMCMWLIKNPNDYSVIVTSNMFGDIISDLCAQLVGGLGFASSGNIGDKYAVFEPTHGSAPKYAGQYKVNPVATFLAAKLMLEWLGETRQASRLETAIAEVIKEGKVRTYDMGGKSSTMDVANAVAAKL